MKSTKNSSKSDHDGLIRHEIQVTWTCRGQSSLQTLLQTVLFRVEMIKALHLAYTLHAKTLTKPLLACNLAKPRSNPCFFARFHDEKGLTLFWRIFLAKQSMFFLSRRCWRCSEAGPWDCCEYSTATLVQLASTARSLSARLMYSCLRKFYKKVLMLEDPLKYIELNV